MADGTACHRAGVWDGVRNSKKDPELSVEGVDNWTVQNGDHLPVQVGVCPCETERGNNALDSLHGLKDSSKVKSLPVTAVNNRL